LVPMLLNLASDAPPMAKLGMRTPRQHVERAAQTAAHNKRVQVTPHQVLLVIMECAKQGKKDAARLRREAMQQLLGAKVCKDPQGMLESLQTYEDQKRSFQAEFAMQLPDEFEEDLLRQQQENAKGSDNADMRALLRRVFEASSHGDKAMSLTELIHEVQVLVTSTAKLDGAKTTKAQTSVPQDLVAAVRMGAMASGEDRKNILCPRLQDWGLCRYGDQCYYKHARVCPQFFKGVCELGEKCQHVHPSKLVSKGAQFQKLAASK